MNLELLRTFLEVRQTRHFARAAQNLYVTQAAVSARIRQLESLTGQRLFSRARNNVQLTPAGHQLVPYAESIVATWSRALMETAAGSRSLVVIGCLPSLREIYLDEWLLSLVESEPSWLLQVESLNSAQTIARVRDRSVGIGIVYEPPQALDVWVEPLTHVDLVLVTTHERAALADRSDYVYVDWGPSFGAAQGALASVAPPRLRLDSPLLGYRVLRAHGGSAYLPSPMIAADLESGSLRSVADAPVIRRNVYLIGSAETVDQDPVRAVAAALHARVVAEPPPRRPSRSRHQAGPAAGAPARRRRR